MLCVGQKVPSPRLKNHPTFLCLVRSRLHPVPLHPTFSFLFLFRHWCNQNKLTVRCHLSFFTIHVQKLPQKIQYSLLPTFSKLLFLPRASSHVLPPSQSHTKKYHSEHVRCTKKSAYFEQAPSWSLGLDHA